MITVAPVNAAFARRQRQRRMRRLRTQNEEQGFWEVPGQGQWRDAGVMYADLEEHNRVQVYWMSAADFHDLHALIGPLIARQETMFGRTVSSEKRLAIFIDWLASGSTLRAVAEKYMVIVTLVHGIVRDVSLAMTEHFAESQIMLPRGDDFQQCADELEELSGIPQCVGAMDGTLCKIRRPAENGDSYFCYKKFPSINLTGVVDAAGQFMYVNAGRPGSVGDAAMWNRSCLKTAVEDGATLFLAPVQINGGGVRLFIVADAAYALTTCVMKSYPNPVTDEEKNSTVNYAAFVW